MYFEMMSTQISTTTATVAPSLSGRGLKTAARELRPWVSR